LVLALKDLYVALSEASNDLDQQEVSVSKTCVRLKAGSHKGLSSGGFFTRSV
jgi:hypothetical protein